MVQFQKLTINLCLTLHGHNVHRKQRQLSKFLMRYQQFASYAYCAAAGPVFKMASQQGKAFCALRFELFRSVITAQSEFRASRFRKDARRRNLDSCRCWRCTLCPCDVRNKFLLNFWNCTILLCIPCIYIYIVLRIHSTQCTSTELYHFTFNYLRKRKTKKWASNRMK
jgi:hypothetical protein